MDPRTPVVIGVAQASRRPSAGDLTDPVAFSADVLRAAAADAGAPVLDRIRSLRQVSSWEWGTTGDPAAAVAAHLGLTVTETVLSETGGDGPQLLLTDACAAIAAGELDMAAVIGCEISLTAGLARKAGTPVPGKDLLSTPTRRLGSTRLGFSPEEVARGFGVPAEVYALLEVLHRTRAGQTAEEGDRAAAELWAGFSAVAAGNPHAWLPQVHTADQILAVGPDNRLVASPYRKLMVANIAVEQASALVVCSAEAAEAAGVPRDRWVFPVAAVHGHDTWNVTARPDPTVSPFLRDTAALLRPLTRDVDLAVDLYSCFPVAVRLAQEAFGLAGDLTLTGGLTFAGGPGNNYVGHSLATAVDQVRAGRTALVTGIGWYATKHAVTVLSPEPGAFVAHRVVAEDGEVALDTTFAGEVTVEAGTTVFNREGAATHAKLLVRTPTGRSVASSADPAFLAAVATDGQVGARVTIDPSGVVLL